MDGSLDRSMDRWNDGLTDIRTFGRTDEWMDRINGLLVSTIEANYFIVRAMKNI